MYEFDPNLINLQKLEEIYGLNDPRLGRAGKRLFRLRPDLYCFDSIGIFGGAQIRKNYSRAHLKRGRFVKFYGSFIGEEIPVPIGAEYLRLKNNCIAFYPHRNCVLKFSREEGVREHKSLQNEFDVLCKAADCSGILTPNPLVFGLQPVPHILSEFVSGGG